MGGIFSFGAMAVGGGNVAVGLGFGSTVVVNVVDVVSIFNKMEEISKIIPLYQPPIRFGPIFIRIQIMHVSNFATSTPFHQLLVY